MWSVAGGHEANPPAERQSCVAAPDHPNSLSHIPLLNRASVACRFFGEVDLPLEGDPAAPDERQGDNTRYPPQGSLLLSDSDVATAN